MEVDITYGSITVRLGGVASYCDHGDGATVQPDNPAGVTVISYTYAVAGTGYQTTNPTGQIRTDVGGDPRILSTVAPGTVIPATHSLVCLFTRATRPPGWISGRSSYIDEALPIVVVSYGPLSTAMAPQLIRPPAIGHPSNATIAALRSTPLVFDNATIGALPAVIDIDALPIQPSPGWGGFFNERPNIDDYIAQFAGFCGELWTGWATEGYTPFLQHKGYGGFFSAWVSYALLMMVSTDDAAKRRQLAQRLTQWGVDLLGSFIHGRQDYVDGGHMQGRKALVVLSGHLLEAPWKDATAFLASIGSAGEFNEDKQFFTRSSPPAWVWGWPHGYIGKSGLTGTFRVNIDEPINTWNERVGYYLSQYFQQEVCGTQLACGVAMRILGLSDEMGVGHRGMMEQWVEGPSAPNEAAMVAHDVRLDNIDWGSSYGADTGTSDFGRAAWEVYSNYEPDVDPPPTAPNINVTGNGNAITSGDDTPSSTDHTSFGTTDEGGATISRTFTVTNSGDKDLTLGAVTVPSGYTITTALPSTIAIGANAPLVVRLDTSVPGTKYGPVSIVSDDPDTPKFEFFVTGTVTPASTPEVVPPPTFPRLDVPMIRLRNHSTSPFRGWIRTTTDTELSGPVSVGAVEIVPARRIGLDVHAVDVWCHLDPNEARELDLEHAQPSNWTPTPVPADPVAHFGGEPRLNGAPMLLVGYAQDGASWRAHYAVRFGRMFLCDLWLRWYPDQPAIVEGECMVTCSNADVPDMGEVLPDFRLTWGDSWQIGALPKAGLRFADGQARAFPVSFVWQRHLRTALDWSTAGCIVHHQIGAVGVSRLLPGGNPSLPADFNLPAWAAQHWKRSYDALTTWEHPQLGPAADTGQTGSVEDQCFVGGEAFIEGGTGAEWINYFAALATSGHPMHHYERDGTVVDKDRRPGLRLFYSRPHSSGTDKLNKGRDLSVEEANGWNGPDAQHWTINRLAAAARLKDSPACQRLLECHARNYLIQLTTTIGWSTSTIWSAREVGWEGIAAVHLYRCLEDRGLAERVKAHWQSRVRGPIRNVFTGKVVWDVRKDDARLGSGEWWMPWQQALGVYGLDLACEILGPEFGRAHASFGAHHILRESWLREGDCMTEYELLALDGRRSRSGMFATAWLPLAVATVLRHEPGNALAREVWQQIVADANGDGRWLEPGVVHAR